MHDETYRMLGREHEADLEREAAKTRLAVEVRGRRRAAAGSNTNRWRTWWAGMRGREVVTSSGSKPVATSKAARVER